MMLPIRRCNWLSRHGSPLASASGPLPAGSGRARRAPTICCEAPMEPGELVALTAAGAGAFVVAVAGVFPALTPANAAVGYIGQVNRDGTVTVAALHFDGSVATAAGVP